MTGELRVDTTPLATGGQGLLSAAGDIPEAPKPFTATGTDALSNILNVRTQAIEAPLIAGMPVTKADALRTAQDIIRAAAKYEGVDQHLADQVLKVLAELEAADGVGTPGASGTGGGAAGVAGMASEAPATDTAQQVGQLGQMMGMPMQMAQQAAQIPMQLAGMAASIPQGIMQGVQSAMQQVGQISSVAGDKADLEQSGDNAEPAKSAEVETERKSSSDSAAGPGTAERAPMVDPQPMPPSEASPQPHKPAPTRPATSGPESVL